MGPVVRHSDNAESHDFIFQLQHPTRGIAPELPAEKPSRPGVWLALHLQGVNLPEVMGAHWPQMNAVLWGEGGWLRHRVSEADTPAVSGQLLTSKTFACELFHNIDVRHGVKAGAQGDKATGAGQGKRQQ